MNSIICRNLTKIYAKQEVPALAGVDLEVKDNTIFGYLGPNGAGKTTTIKILTGLMLPSSGTAEVAGYQVNLNSLKVRARIGYLSQAPSYYTWMKGLELLLFTGELFGLSVQENRNRAWQLLELAGLKRAAQRKIGTYSGGMVQRIGIAQALMSRPRVLFLDEPVSSLDPLGRKEVLEFIAALKAETTVFMSTHILEDVERICDEVGIIDKGKILVREDISSLLKKYAHSRVEIGFEAPADEQRFSALLASYSWNKTVTLAKGLFTFNLPDFSALRQEILKLISVNNLSLKHLITRSATLEDVFVKLVGGDHA